MLPLFKNTMFYHVLDMNIENGSFQFPQSVTPLLFDEQSIINCFEKNSFVLPFFAFITDVNLSNNNQPNYRIYVPLALTKFGPTLKVFLNDLPFCYFFFTDEYFFTKKYGSSSPFPDF